MNYTLKRKRNMKNIIISIKDGGVYVSAPVRVSKYDIDKFVQSKADWIQKHLENPPLPFENFDDAVCLDKFNKISENVYPLIKHRIPNQPEIRVKDYKSRWGVCYHKRGYVILNKRLFEKPDLAIEYVILHEYVHFLVQNHGEDFHKIMAELMPDYKQRRNELRQ